MSEPEIKPSKTWRTRALEGLLLLGSVLVSLVILELGARYILFGSLSIPDFASERVLLDVHPTRGWAPVPGATLHLQRLEYSAGVHVNAKGIRDKNHPYEKPPGVYRIVLLGDSFMFARQMNVSQILANRLEQNLDNVEVINLGVDAYGPAQSYLALKEEGLKYDPDLVLLSVFPMNDILESSSKLSRLFWPDSRYSYSRPYPRWNEESGALSLTEIDVERAAKDRRQDMKDSEEQQANRSFWERSAIYTYYDFQRQHAEQAPEGRNMPRLDPNIYLGAFIDQFDPDAFTDHDLSMEDYQRHWNEAWKNALRTIEEIHQLALENDAGFALFLVPDKLQVEEHWMNLAKETWPNIQFDTTGPVQRILGFAESNNIPALDLTPAFREVEAEEPKTLFYELRDQHWTPKGHAVATDALAQFLRDNDLVPSN